MGYNNFARNISGTVCAIGLAVSAVSANSTILVNTSVQAARADYRYFDGYSATSHEREDNFYYGQRITRVENIAEELFGAVRDATQEERDSASNYIKSISKDTGVNFFDLC